MNELAPEEYKREDIKPLSDFQFPKQNYGLSKGMKWFLGIAISITCLFFIFNLIWFNVSVSDGLFKSNDTINNQVTTPDIPVNIDDRDTNNYEHTINNNIQIDKKTIENITNEIIEGVLEGLNDTN